MVFQSEESPHLLVGRFLFVNVSKCILNVSFVEVAFHFSTPATGLSSIDDDISAFGFIFLSFLISVRSLLFLFSRCALVRIRTFIVVTESNVADFVVMLVVSEINGHALEGSIGNLTSSFSSFITVIDVR